MSTPLDLTTIAPALTWLEDRARERGYTPATLSGIALGGCADAFGTSRVGAMRHAAHTHTTTDDLLRGWICVAAYSADRLVTSTGLPSVLFRHEYAHLLAPNDHGHGSSWRRAVTALGAPGEARAAERRSAHRRARAENTVYYLAGEPVTREQYLDAIREERTR